MKDERVFREFEIKCGDESVFVPSLFVPILTGGMVQIGESSALDNILVIPSVTSSVVERFMNAAFGLDHDDKNDKEIVSSFPWIDWTKFETVLLGKNEPHRRLEDHDYFSQSGFVKFIVDDIVQDALDKSAKPSKLPTNLLKTKTEPCSICGKVLHDKKSLKKHVNTIHLNIKPHACQVCQKRFPVRNELLDHVRTVHDKIKVRELSKKRAFNNTI